MPHPSSDGFANVASGYPASGGIPPWAGHPDVDEGDPTYPPAKSNRSFMDHGGPRAQVFDGRENKERTEYSSSAFSSVPSGQMKTEPAYHILSTMI